MATTIIAKNLTAGDLPLDNLSAPNRIIPASGQVTLTTTNPVFEIQTDTQLLSYVTAGYVILNDGTTDLTLDQSTSYLSTTTLTVSSSTLDTFVQTKNPAQVVTVATSGGDFDSVAAAIASITDATSTKTYMVSVYPGEYTEAPFSMKPYVSVVGADGIYSVHIKTNNNAAHFITGDAGSELLNVALTGPTGVGYATVDYQTASMIPFVLDHVIIRGGYYGVWCHPAAARGVIHAFFVTDHYVGNPAINQLFRSTDYGNITCMNSAKMSGPAGSCVTGWSASGPHAEFTLDLCAFRDANGTAFFADDGAYYRLTACTVSKADKALHIGSTGTASEFQAVGCVIGEDQVTTHIQTDTPNCVIEYQGSAWSSRFALTSGTPAFIMATDSDAQAVTVIGELQVGSLDTAVPVGNYLRNTASTAVFEGVSIARNSGLDLDIGAGNGFISDGASIKKVTWSADTITLTASSTAWILVDSLGAIQEVFVEPDYYANLVLAVTTTNATSIIFLAPHFVPSGQTLPLRHEYLEEVIGPVSVSGCATVKHSSPSLQVDVDGGKFYIAENDFTAVAHSPINFTYWYRDGGSGWKWLTSQTIINVTQYDDGSGTLASLTGTNFRRDTIFLAVSSSGTEYHAVLGQEQFASSVLAINNPTPPEQLRLNALRVAAVVVQKSATDIDTIYNQLPVLGQLSTGTTGVTVHGALSGLSANDHTQYQLRTEKDVANGYAGLTAGTQIATSQLPFTATPPVNVTKSAAAVGTATEIARQDHKHDVSTAAASTIGTANSEGSATSLARSDHGHDHGAQTSGTLHAAVIAGSTSGFMTGADKTKLDGITAGATNTPLTASAPADVTKAVAAVGVSSSAARADHKHDIATAAPGHDSVATLSGEGTATTLARSDHTHHSATAPVNVTKAAADIGTSGEPARADHKHDITTATAATVGTANAEGTSTSLSRADHVHSHGSQTVGTLHAAVISGSTSGFMTGTDKAKLDGISTNAAALTATAPVNVTKVAADVGTSTTAARADHKHDITTAVAAAVGTANAEGSATSLSRSDHVHDHGAQTSGTLHAAVIAAGASGFMTGADKTKLDGIASGATATELATAAPLNITKSAAAVGVGTTAARDDHKHDVSTAAAVAVGAANAEGTSTSLARADHTHQVTDLTLASQAQGDILYFDGTNWVRLAAGTANYVLQTNGPGADPTWVAVAATSVFGQNQQYAAVEARTTTTSATFQVKTTLTTPTLTGTYYVAWTALTDGASSNASVESRLYDSTNAVIVGAACVLEPKDTTGRMPVGDFIQMTFTAQARTFQIQFRSPNGADPAGIQSARIQIWRVA